MHTHSLSIHPDSGRALRPWELALLLAVCVTLLTGTWAQARSALLASRLVRLHVIAVSDDDTEQAVKLQVRDAVLAYLELQLADVTDMDTARLRIADDLDGIARAAQAAAGERPVRVSLGPEHYPTRDYGTFALPAGVYTSLRVTLGAGEGHNWWCVIFPPLCAQAALGADGAGTLGRRCAPRHGVRRRLCRALPAAGAVGRARAAAELTHGGKLKAPPRETPRGGACHWVTQAASGAAAGRQARQAPGRARTRSPARPVWRRR